jgi:hypothetical protein
MGSICCGNGARYSVYLLYWYKSTNTDAPLQVADFLVQKSEY